MSSTSGILGALGLIFMITIAFQWNAQKEYEDKIDAPSDHLVFELPVNT